MNDDPRKSRLQAIAARAIAAEAAGTIEGWRDYLASEMKTAGLTGSEVAEEIKRLRAEIASGGK